MLHRLEDHYGRIRPLFEDLAYHLVIDSVVDGNTPGWVYADDPADPQIALLWNRQDALLLAGDPGNPAANEAVGRLITGEVIPDARRRGIPELWLGADLARWEPQIGSLLAGLNPQKAGRRFYTFAGSRIDWRARMPAGARLLRIDEPLLAGVEPENVGQVAGWVASFWRSAGNFARAGFGFCLVAQETVASWCLSVYASGDDYELGLATMPAYRNRGLATLAAAACVELCEVHGWTPHWHCWEDNLPSMAVAAKAGFVDPVSYAVYRFDL